MLALVCCRYIMVWPLSRAVLRLMGGPGIEATLEPYRCLSKGANLALSYAAHCGAFAMAYQVRASAPGSIQRANLLNVSISRQAHVLFVSLVCLPPSLHKHSCHSYCLHSLAGSATAVLMARLNWIVAWPVC